MTRQEELIHEAFEEDCKVAGITHLSFSSPYMAEYKCGYDSPLTNNVFRGWLLAKGHYGIMEAI